MTALAAARAINRRVIECLRERGIEAPLDCLPTDEEIEKIVESAYSAEPAAGEKVVPE
jgi:hypothetical protein